jgi:hypothetical protein
MITSDARRMLLSMDEALRHILFFVLYTQLDPLVFTLFETVCFAIVVIEHKRMMPFPITTHLDRDVITRFGRVG